MQFPNEPDPNAKPGQRGHMGAYVSPFGQPEGIADRLRDAIKKLGVDKSLPWVGLGLIADLQCAATMLDGKPTLLPLTEARGEVFAQLAREKLASTAWKEPAAPASAMEFDL